jgi:hypothetical protein
MTCTRILIFGSFICSSGKSLAILCSSIAWQQSEKARLKLIDDKRREVDSAKAAALQKAASASTSSVNHAAAADELEHISPEDFPLAFAADDTRTSASAVISTAAIDSLESPIIPALSAPPLKVEFAVKSEPSADSQASLNALTTTSAGFPIKPDNRAQLSSAFSLQKSLRAVAPPSAPHVVMQAVGAATTLPDDDFQPEKALVKRLNKKQVVKPTVVEPKVSIAASASSAATGVDASILFSDAAAVRTAADEVPTAAAESDANASIAAAGVAASADLEKKESLSRIYICSRTHSQLSQLIKGLKSTVYTPSMAVLGSREQMCIHPTVMLSETKNEDCSKLIGGSDASGCSFFQSANVLANHPSMRVVWDIEDIVTKGRQFRACPYFTAKDIAERADVVFCPYNYVIDKLIRESSGIHLKNNIVIFDEAHNLEDQCREAASFVVTVSLLNAAIEMVNVCSKFPNCPAEAASLCSVLLEIRSWIQEREGFLSSDATGERILEYVAEQVPLQFSSIGLSPETVKQTTTMADKLQEWHKELIELSEEADAFRWTCPTDGKTHSVVPAFSVCMRTVQMILLVVGYAHEFRADYAICFQQKSADPEVRVHIWCLNPGVAFRDLREQCRSVVLTSGA